MIAARLMESDLIIAFGFFALRCYELTFGFTAVPSWGQDCFCGNFLFRVLFEGLSISDCEGFAARYFRRLQDYDGMIE